MKEEEASPSSSCGEIDRWRVLTPTSNSLFQNSAQFNSTSGRFKAQEDGIYLVSANILIRNLGSSQMNMTILLDGRSSNNALNTFQPRPSNSPTGDFVSTLTLVGAVRLIPEQYLSIFIQVQCQGASSWKVLANSSFSAVLVSRWESDYTAGFLGNTSDDGNGASVFGKVFYWQVAMFSKNLDLPEFSPVNVRSSGLYFLQSVLILNDITGNATFDSGVCLDNKIAFNGITASKVSEGLNGKFVISASGVLYLRKGQNVGLCTRSENAHIQFQNMRGSWFSMARFLAPGQQPGLHQILQHNGNTSASCEKSVIRSASTAGDQLTYINNNVFNPNLTLPCDKGDFMATLTGTYFISLIFTLNGNVPQNVTACAGPRKCAECHGEIFIRLSQHNCTFAFAGLIDLKKNELISVCLKSQQQAFNLVTATRSVHFLSELNKTVQLQHPSVNYNSSGWHELVQWQTPSGKSLQKIYVMESGFYVLSTNLQINVAVESLVGVKLETTGLTNPEVLSISSSAKPGSSVSFSVAVLADLKASEALTVSVYSNSNALNTGNNFTFFAALITKANQHPCLSLRSKTSRYSGGEWWQGIEQWEYINSRCLSANSDFNKGRFVADVAGVYFVAAVVMVRISNQLYQTR